MAASCSVRAALFILLLGQAWGSGTFELRILQFVNGESSLASGGHCVPDCRTFFRVCLKHFQVLVSPGTCTYGTLLSPLMGSGSFRVASTHSPLRLNFTFKWPGTFSLIIEAWNSPPSQLTPNVTSPEMLISRFAIQRRQSVGSTWSRDNQRRQLTQLHYSYRVVCSHHYYGEGCSRYCRPRNDTFGHFTCGALGQRICMDGWANEYCSRPICRSGCSAQHGYCHRPGECKCHFGWQGESCNDCMRHPGCLHGTCEQPFQCTCREGWGGLFCNQENRLRKLKGLNEEPSSKGMLRSLSQAKKECWDRFLHEQCMSEMYIDGYEMDQSAIDSLKRWVLPDRVPVNTEEIQHLISPESFSASQEEPEGQGSSNCEQ